MIPKGIGQTSIPNPKYLCICIFQKRKQQIQGTIYVVLIRKYKITTIISSVEKDSSSDKSFIHFQDGNPLLGQPALWGPNVEEFRKGVHFSCPFYKDCILCNNTNRRGFLTDFLQYSCLVFERISQLNTVAGLLMSYQ